MTVLNDVDLLAPAFAGKVRLLQERLARDGLPFVVFETVRPFSRQNALYMQGRRKNTDGSVVKTGPTVTNARAGQSPHQWGLAADFVLDVDSVWWEGAKPRGPWDAGDAQRPLPKLAWAKFGRLAKETGLVWGGGWSSVPDLPHVEMPGWQSLRPKNWLEVAEEAIRTGR